MDNLYGFSNRATREASIFLNNNEIAYLDFMACKSYGAVRELCRAYFEYDKDIKFKSINITELFEELEEAKAFDKNDENSMRMAIIETK